MYNRAADGILTYGNASTIDEKNVFSQNGKIFVILHKNVAGDLCNTTNGQNDG